jgi:molybdenum cofactor cytidylyltransferase
MIGAVVLAAGRSRRMGRPKMTLSWGNTTVIGQVVSVLLVAGVEDVVVVTGGDRDGVETALSELPVRTVFNPNYVNGEMMLTLQFGLAALKEKTDTALVVLGDQPQIEARIVQSVIAAHLDGRHSIVVPSHQMRRGHPWLVDRILWKAILDLSPPATMRTFLHHHVADIHYVNVDTPTILLDLDTQQDYERYKP